MLTMLFDHKPRAHLHLFQVELSERMEEQTTHDIAHAGVLRERANIVSHYSHTLRAIVDNKVPAPWS